MTHRLWSSMRFAQCGLLNTLAGLEASINVMPYKMFKQLGLGKPKHTRMSIQLADRTIRYLTGIIQDVLVQIDKFIFPIHFVVLDMDEDSEEIPRKNMLEPCFSQGDRIQTPYEERMVQLDELHEWRTHVEEKLRKHDEDTRQCHDVDVIRINQFKDPQIYPSELESNGSNPVMVRNVFPYGQVEVTHSEFDTFKANNTRLKPYLGVKIDKEKEELRP
ncbi:hypothetical protein GOBAR_DD06775 [Gossypium barbadense]|nr:hypothetical protein GOBAR_DD06775 [Gossypium barbadense]